MVKNLLKKSLLIGMGALTLTREKAERVVRELEQKGEITSREASEFINELMEKGEQERNALRKTIGQELERLIKTMGLATKTDIKALEERLDRLEGVSISALPARQDVSGHDSGFSPGE